MKNLIFLALLALVALPTHAITISNPLNQQKEKKLSAKEQKKQQFQSDLLAKLKSGSFQFYAERAHTKIPGRNIINIAGDQYRVDVMDTVVRLQMPYYGTSNTAGYGSRDNPLTFTGPVKNVTLSGAFNEDDGLRLLVRAENQHAKTCDLIFYIYSDGSARLLVNIQGLSTIEFWGYIPEK